MPQNSFQYPRVGVAVLLLNPEGKLLLSKRSSAHGVGTWACPGGHLEKFETPEACAVREMREETGLILKKPSFFDLTNDYFPESGKHYVTLFYIDLLEEGTPQVTEPHKNQQWLWLPLDSLPTPQFSPLASLTHRPRFQSLAAQWQRLSTAH